MFRANAKDSAQQDIRKFGTIRQAIKVKIQEDIENEMWSGQ